MNLCLCARFDQDLELPSLPEMVFPESTLRLEHESGAVLEFLALDALKPVNPSEDLLKVAVAEEWTRQRCVAVGEGGREGGEGRRGDRNV